MTSPSSTKAAEGPAGPALPAALALVLVLVLASAAGMTPPAAAQAAAPQPAAPQPAAPQAATAHPRPGSFVLFPDSERVFRQLIADPRHIALGASYYRQGGRDTADAALGHSWGLAHWATNGGFWQWQTNLEAMAYSRFIVGGSVNQFETVDFFANLPLAVRHGIWSARGMLYHESSHLGDDYIRRTGDRGFRYSVEGLQLHFSAEPFPWLRAYAGMKQLLHVVPAQGRSTAQYGLELTSRDLDSRGDYPMKLFLAQDFQNPAYNDYNLNSNTELGVIIGFREVQRVMRVFAGYYTGRSPYGQFFRQKEHYLDLGVSFHL